MFFSHVNIPLFLSPSFSKISKKKYPCVRIKKFFLEGRNVSRSQHCINFTTQTSIEEGSRGPLWDSPLGAHSSLWGCRSMGCSRDTEASTFSLWVGCDLPIDTKSNNNRLRPQGWPGLGVSLGWLPSCKMVPPPQAQHRCSFQLLLSVWVPGRPSTRGHCSVQALQHSQNRVPEF